MLKQRLRSDNPQKQFLAVVLVGKARAVAMIVCLLIVHSVPRNSDCSLLPCFCALQILAECNAAVGAHQDEVLAEVARIVAKPSRRDSTASLRAKGAARDLLRSYGRSGKACWHACCYLYTFMCP